MDQAAACSAAVPVGEAPAVAGPVPKVVPVREIVHVKEADLVRAVLEKVVRAKAVPVVAPPVRVDLVTAGRVEVMLISIHWSV